MTRKHQAEEQDPNKVHLIVNGKPIEIFDKFLNEMFGSLKKATEPRLLIVLTSAYLELLTNDLIEKHCIDHKRILKDSRSYSWSVKKVILFEKKVIDQNRLKELDWFRKLRNRAAHRAFFEITKEDIQNYPGTSDVANITLREGPFWQFCQYIVGNWIGSDPHLQWLVLGDTDEVASKHK